MRNPIYIFFVCALCLVCGCDGTKIKDGTYEITLLATNDVHGTWFGEDYVTGIPKKSLMSIMTCIDSVRKADGKENVVLLDAGDCLQGDNAPYYYNFIDTVTPHLFPRLAKYMGYDAITVGNHDIEPGHAVYDRVRKQLEDYKIPFLAGNAIREDDSKPYFRDYVILKKNNLKIAVIGYTNPNIAAWVPKSHWEGMRFESLIPYAQENVNRIREKEKPDLVILSIHSGLGKGDGTILESQAMDLYKSIKGVDLIVCSHDHRPYIDNNDSIAIINSGSHSRNVAYARISLSYEKGKLKNKNTDVKLIPVDPSKTDSTMFSAFHDDFIKVKEFTLREIGFSDVDFVSRDSYIGMSPYINFIHRISLYGSGADVSFAAPLNFDTEVKKGKIIYNDLFKIYPYENNLVVVEMTGNEIKNYLEYSYDGWINGTGSEHLLKIQNKADERYGKNRWSFVNRSYNFDSAGGLVYTVDLSKPFGQRISIVSMTGGRPFHEDSKYNVAMTSYRASGAGDLITKGAGIDINTMDGRIKERLKDIRSIIYDYIKDNETIRPEEISDPGIIGNWKFVPEDKVGRRMREDLKLLFK